MKSVLSVSTILFIGLLVLLQGCVSANLAVMAERGPYASSALKRVAVIAANDAKRDPILFAQIIESVSESLAENGYTIVAPDAEKDLFIWATFFDTGRENTTVTSVQPIYGMTNSGGTSTFSATTQPQFYGRGNSYNITGQSYQPPQYGIAGAVPVTKTIGMNYYGLRLDGVTPQEFKQGRLTPTWQVVVSGSTATPNRFAMLTLMAKEAAKYAGKQLPRTKTRSAYLE